MGPPRQLAAAFDREKAILCMCLTQARTPDIVLIAASAGFDAVYIDLEHGVTPLDVTSALCSAALGAGLVPLVRIPAVDPPMITRVLDGGALGVIVPHVATPEQAKEVVDVCRFPPVGARSLYGATPVTGYRSLPADELVSALDGEVVVALMIESGTAVDNAAKIAAVDGVDMLLVGTHDLSTDLGVARQMDHPLMADAFARVAAACAEHGRRFGVAGVGDPSILRSLLGLGLGFISAGTDTGFLQQAATARVADLRKLTSEKEPSS